MKKETLEEAANKAAKVYAVYESGQDDVYQGFVRGAEWQADRMYTKEDMMFFAGFCMGKKQKFPNMSATEIFDEWEKNLKHISHG